MRGDPARESAILCEEVKTSLSDKAEFERNLKECGFLGENIAGRGNSKHKGHQAGGPWCTILGRARRR